MKIEIENEFSESTPNSSGIPSKDKNSKKLKKVKRAFVFRFLILICIALFTFFVHYILENVIDVI